MKSCKCHAKEHAKGKPWLCRIAIFRLNPMYRGCPINWVNRTQILKSVHCNFIKRLCPLSNNSKKTPKTNDLSILSTPCIYMFSNVCLPEMFCSAFATILLVGFFFHLMSSYSCACFQFCLTSRSQDAFLSSFVTL